MKGLWFVDADYCQFAEWGYKKPTRFWGCKGLGAIPHALCDRKNCPNLLANSHNHREMLGGPHLKITKTQKYRIPEKLVMYLAKNLLDAQFSTPPPSPLVDSNPPRAWELEQARTFVKALEIPPIQFFPKKSTS
jgi:hypothetical protein